MFEQQFLGMVPIASSRFEPWMGQGTPPDRREVGPMPVQPGPTGPPPGFEGCERLGIKPFSANLEHAKSRGFDIHVGPDGVTYACPPWGWERAHVASEAARTEKREDRICAMLKKFSEGRPGGAEEADARSRIFWSYIRQQARSTGQGEDAVAQTVHARCPDMTLPSKPPPPGPIKPPGQEGFHGKTRLPYAEAKELSDLLTVVLTPLSPEEAAKELAREQCLRDIVQADGFPIVDRLQERLKDFLATAKQTDTFEISSREAVVTGKAVECAEAIGRIKTIRTVATVGGVTAGGAGLLWLIGIL